MPRRNRRAPEEGPQRARPPHSAAPPWARVPGIEVRRLTSDKPYRCPGCDLEIRPGTWHFVVVPAAPEERRHWHERCWQVELNRTRGRGQGV